MFFASSTAYGAKAASAPSISGIAGSLRPAATVQARALRSCGARIAKLKGILRSSSFLAAASPGLSPGLAPGAAPGASLVAGGGVGFAGAWAPLRSRAPGLAGSLPASGLAPGAPGGGVGAAPKLGIFFSLGSSLPRLARYESRACFRVSVPK